MDNIKELLKKIDGVPETDDMKEVEKWLKTRNKQKDYPQGVSI